MARRSTGPLIVALFVGALVGNLAGEALRLVFQTVGMSPSVVERVLVLPLVQYEFPPSRLNLILLTVTFGFTIQFSLFTLLGMGLAWHYFKYSY